MKQVIKIQGARTHNLKNISLEIPRNKLVVLTGLSGSGKSSLAFDTIYAEAQRRYLENLSGDLGKMANFKSSAEVDGIEGLSPAIAIDQKNIIRTPRSTVGTMTEIYDYLRLLFSKIGTPHCPECAVPLIKFSPPEIFNEIIKIKKNNPEKILILSPISQKPFAVNRIEPYNQFLAEAKSEGFSKIKIAENIYPIDEFLKNGSIPFTVNGSIPFTVNSAADPPNFLPNSEKVGRVDEKTSSVRNAISNGASPYLLIGEIFAFDTIENPEEKAHLKEMINSALKYGRGKAVIHCNGKNFIFTVRYSCSRCDFVSENLSPKLFSFNHPLGACPTCTGLGLVLKISPDLIIPNKKLTLAEGAIKPWMSSWISWADNFHILKSISEKFNFSVDVPISNLKREAMDIIMRGEKNGGWKGVAPALEEKYRETNSEFVKSEIEQYMVKRLCPACLGKRLNSRALSVKIAGKSINDFVQTPIKELYIRFKNHPKHSKSKKADYPALRRRLRQGEPDGFADSRTRLDSARLVTVPIVKEIVSRLEIISKINLGYLTLSRSSDTLSAGEVERLRLAAQISASLSGILYVLDEPSIGLHPRDNEKIIKMLLRLRDLDNSVLVVEHEEAFIRAADFVVDIGPGAGKFGGEVVAIGKLKDIVKSRGFTGAYLSGKLKITREKKKVDPKSGKNGFLEIFGASEFNLKNIDVKIPIAKLVCLTGVSGSGKSTLLDDILGRYLSKYFYGAKAEAGKHKKISGVENFKKVIRIDQSPIGRTPRSNAATYTGLFNHIREIFTATKEAKKQGYRSGHFSFNVKGGRCESCKGDGMKKIEMYFLSDVYLPCEECGGARYNEDTLKVKYREKNIAEILDLSAEEALKFFSGSGDQALLNQLAMLLKVGLGYLRLGQPATNLSGGEAQRIKLSTELSRPEKQGATLYILDEPTVGLHPEDMRNLLNVLSELVERGNTVLLIEHNLDIIKNADWIIDMGPEGGDKGGEIVAEGTPEQVAKIKKSYTGQFLKKVLKH